MARPLRFRWASPSAVGIGLDDEDRFGLMMFEYHAQDGTLTLSLHGWLDAEAARALRPVVERLAEGGAPHIVLDLGGVAFMDGSGLGALAFLLKRAGPGRVSLAGVSGQPRAFLGHLGLGGMLEAGPDARRGGAAGWRARLAAWWRSGVAAGPVAGGGLAWARPRG